MKNPLCAGREGFFVLARFLEFKHFLLILTLREVL
jgi:hypothetical protein